MYRYGDLRQWFRTGVIREVRPVKYATDDVLRIYPNLFEDGSFAGKKFVISYTFNRRAQCFKLLRLRAVPLAAKQPGAVQFPAR